MFLIIGCYQEHFLCAVLGTMCSRFCVPDTVCGIPDIIWNIVPNNIRHIFLISDLILPGICIEIKIDLNPKVFLLPQDVQIESSYTSFQRIRAKTMEIGFPD